MIPPKKRGRPRKNEPEPNELPSPLAQPQKDRLRDLITNIPQVACLTHEQQSALVEKVAEVLPHYKSTGDALKKAYPNKRGPRPKFHRANLLIDCARAWASITRKPGDEPDKHGPFWVRESSKLASGTMIASVPVLLAQAATTVIDKEVPLTTWRSQCDVARKILKHTQTYLCP